jgi:hypothetical protein
MKSSLCRLLTDLTRGARSFGSSTIFSFREPRSGIGLLSILALSLLLLPLAGGGVPLRAGGMASLPTGQRHGPLRARSSCRN